MARMPICSSNPAAMAASRPCGARISALYAGASGIDVTRRRPVHESSVADQCWHALQDTLEVVQRRAERRSHAADGELPDRGLVAASPLLDDGDRAPHRTDCLEEAEQDDRIGHVGNVHGGPYLAH